MCKSETPDVTKVEEVNGSGLAIDGGIGVAPTMTYQTTDAKHSLSDNSHKGENASVDSSSSPSSDQTSASPPFGQRRMKRERQNKTSMVTSLRTIREAGEATIGADASKDITVIESTTSLLEMNFSEIDARFSTCSLLSELQRSNAELRLAKERLAEKERNDLVDREKKLAKEKEAEDQKLAEKLQLIEEDAARKASAIRMTKSSEGKAVLAVQEIIALVNTTKEKFINSDPALKSYSVEPVMIDDMVFMAKNMLDKQKEFIRNNLPGKIDVGYHYTDQGNIRFIRTYGLLTKAERQATKVNSTQQNASVFGDGIYTANSCTNFSKYGDTGLLVARLMGKMVRVAKSLPPGEIVDANTVIGDKLNSSVCKSLVYWDGWPINDSYHEFVLRSSTQCLPMVKFDKALTNHRAGIYCIRFLQYSLELILNKLFNEGVESCGLLNAPLLATAPTRAPVPLPVSGMSQYQYQQSGFSSAGPRALMADNHANRISNQRKMVYNAPQSLATGVPPNALIEPPASCTLEECTICHEILNQRYCVGLKACNHVFHVDCIHKAFEFKHQCPVCRILIGSAPQGKSPSGTMTVSSSPICCAGFQCDSFVISYIVPAAIQLSYHDNPGHIHSSKVVTAYLPNNEEGKDLLKRLKFSFMHGLSFTVGTSLTTNLADQCTWSSIHHKTSHSGGTRSHGFPDLDYFRNCNKELDSFGVPSAHALDETGVTLPPAPSHTTLLSKGATKISNLGATTASAQTISSFSIGSSHVDRRLRRGDRRYQKLLFEFYQKHNPQKVSEIAKTLDNYKGNEHEMFANLAVKYNTSNPLELKATPSSLPPSSTGSFFAFGSMSASKSPFGGGDTTSPFGAAVGASSSMTGAAPTSNSTSAFGARRVDNKSIFGSTPAAPLHSKNPFSTVGTVPAFGTGTLVGSTVSPFGGSCSGSAAPSTAPLTAPTSNTPSVSGFGAEAKEKNTIFGAKPSQNKSYFRSPGTTSAVANGIGGSTLSPFGGASGPAFGGIVPPAVTPFPGSQVSFLPLASETASAPISTGASALISANVDPSMLGVSALESVAAPSAGAGSHARMRFSSAASLGVAPVGGVGGGTFCALNGFGSIAQGEGFGGFAAVPSTSASSVRIFPKKETSISTIIDDSTPTNITATKTTIIDVLNEKATTAEADAKHNVATNWKKTLTILQHDTRQEKEANSAVGLMGSGTSSATMATGAILGVGDTQATLSITGSGTTHSFGFCLFCRIFHPTSPTKKPTFPRPCNFYGNPVATSSPILDTATAGGQAGTGTATAEYQAVKVLDGTTTLFMHAITAMPQYDLKSFEELRLEDYTIGNKAPVSIVAERCSSLGAGSAITDAPATHQLLTEVNAHEFGRTLPVSAQTISPCSSTGSSTANETGTDVPIPGPFGGSPSAHGASVAAPTTLPLTSNTAHSGKAASTSIGASFEWVRMRLAVVPFVLLDWFIFPGLLTLEERIQNARDRLRR